MRRGNSGGVRNVQSVVPVLWSVLIALSALQHSHAFPPSASPSASPTAFPPASSLNRRPFSLSKMHITTAEELLSGLEQKAQDGQPVCGVALDIDETLVSLVFLRGASQSLSLEHRWSLAVLSRVHGVCHEVRETRQNLFQSLSVSLHLSSVWPRTVWLAGTGFLGQSCCEVEHEACFSDHSQAPF